MKPSEVEGPASPTHQPRAAQPGHVYLAGAGPGSPDLLTLRAHHLLQTATRILPDDLVSREVLSLAGPAAEIIPVGKRCGAPRVTQAEINHLLVQSAHAGHSVLRLKSGDPLVFGRAGEEIAALRSAGIPFEIVPGITAAFAAAAALRTPLTDRTSASKLILATAHHAANKAELDRDPQPVWRGPLPPDATLVLYMPGRDFEALARELIACGIDAATRCTAISRVSTPHERIHIASLGTLHTADVGPSPVLLLVGEAIKPV